MLFPSLAVALVASLFIGVAWISISKLERFLFYITGYFLGGDVQSRVALAAPVDRDTMITVDGDLVTYLRIRGARRLIGPRDFDRMADKLADQLSVKLRDGTGKQHAFSMGFLSDPPGTPNLISNLMRGARATARRMGAAKEADVWFNDKEASLSEVCNDEQVILAIYTLRSGLNGKESERYAQWMQSMRQKVNNDKTAPVKGGEASDRLFNQPILPVYPVLASRHNAMVSDFMESVENESGGIGVIVDRLDCPEAIYCLRRFVDGTAVPANWRPQLFGYQADERQTSQQMVKLVRGAPAGSVLRREGDLAHVQPLPIARQIFSEAMQESFDGFEIVEREGDAA